MAVNKGSISFLISSILLSIGLIVGATIISNKFTSEPTLILEKGIDAIIKKTKYYRDPNTGACFALISSRKGPFGGEIGGLGFTWVPCEICGSSLINPYEPPKEPVKK